MNIVSFAIGLNNSSQGGGDIPPETLVLTGNCSYLFANTTRWNWFWEKYSNQITTNNLTKISYMFYDNYGLEIPEFPFEFNFTANGEYANYTENAFNSLKLYTMPILNNMIVSTSFFEIFQHQQSYIRTIPANYTESWHWEKMDNAMGMYQPSLREMFNYWHSLRSFPLELLLHAKNSQVQNYYKIYYNSFEHCYALDELTLPMAYIDDNYPSTQNMFNQSFQYCYRLKKIVFMKQENGQPYIAPWKNQTIELNNYIGFLFSGKPLAILKYNSGITADKEVKDDATYQALKNNPDWFATNIAYSRYNHDSAVETINSLPDTSAYLAENGGTNTIVFTGASGSKTDGGAINTLTEEEIAVATAKGWAVSFT